MARVENVNSGSGSGENLKQNTDEMSQLVTLAKALLESMQKVSDVQQEMVKNAKAEHDTISSNSKVSHDTTQDLLKRYQEAKTYLKTLEKGTEDYEAQKKTVSDIKKNFKSAHDYEMKVLQAQINTSNTTKTASERAKQSVSDYENIIQESIKLQEQRSLGEIDADTYKLMAKNLAEKGKEVREHAITSVQEAIAEGEEDFSWGEDYLGRMQQAKMGLNRNSLQHGYMTQEEYEESEEKEQSKADAAMGYAKVSFGDIFSERMGLGRSAYTDAQGVFHQATGQGGIMENINNNGFGDTLLRKISESSVGDKIDSGLGKLGSSLQKTGIGGKAGSALAGLGKNLSGAFGKGGGLMSSIGSLVGKGGLAKGMGAAFGGALTKVMPPWVQVMIKVVGAISGAITAIRKAMTEYVNRATRFYSENSGKVASRLYGDYLRAGGLTEIVLTTQTLIGATPYLSQEKLLNNIVELVGKGVDYNIEQRAYWATLQDTLVSTFDAMDDKLLRLIRLQQADVTMSQMGMESILTHVLNSTFMDSSYLNTMYDTVNDALTDSMSTMTDNDQLTQYQYSVQKWLGALYSVGASEKFIQNIAEAINILGTGDVNNLNEGANTLLQLAAVRGGLSYADLLTEGLTGDTTNTLLKSMIEYLADIASNTSDNVVRTQFSNIFSMQMSDWKALSNLTQQDVAKISNSTVNQAEAIAEVTKLMLLLPTRMHLSTMISNAVDNAMYSFGLSIASVPTEFLNWTITSTINKLVEGMDDGIIKKILTVVNNFASLGTIIFGLISVISSVATALATGGLNNFMATPFFSMTMNRGGTSIVQTSSGETLTNVSSGTSESAELSVTNGGTVLITGSNGVTVAESTGGVAIESPEGSVDINEVNQGTTSTVQSSTADIAETNFQAVEDETTMTAQDVVSGESGVLRSIDDLYAELFENQNHPIKVNLVTSSGSESLSDKIVDTIAQIAALSTKVQSGVIRVDIDDNDISQIMSAVRS